MKSHLICQKLLPLDSNRILSNHFLQPRCDLPDEKFGALFKRCCQASKDTTWIHPSKGTIDDNLIK
jgi:hypothetical protein